MAKLAPELRGPWDLWYHFVNSLIIHDDQREQVQRTLGVALLSDEYPVNALYLMGPKGSGKSSFSDAIRYAVGTNCAQTTSQSSVQAVDTEGFTNSATWPEASILFIDEFELTKSGHVPVSPTLYKLCTGDPVPTRRMRQMPTTEDVSCQVVIMSVFRPDHDKMPISMQRRTQVMSIARSSRQSQINKMGRRLSEECSDCILCWLADGAAKNKKTPQLTGRALSSIFGFKPASYEKQIAEMTRFTSDPTD
jgi:hypothetical protein